MTDGHTPLSRSAREASVIPMAGSDMHQAGRSSSEVLWHRSRNRGLQPCRTRLFTFGHGRPLTTNLLEIDFAAVGRQ